jgi:hypothetical protein
VSISPSPELAFLVSSKHGDSPVWPATSDEYAASPIDVIRSFLGHQKRVYHNWNQLNNLLVVAAGELDPHTVLSSNTTTLYVCLVASGTTRLIDWERRELLGWYNSVSQSDPNPVQPLTPYLTTPTYSLLPVASYIADEQLTFPVTTEFSPSKELVDLWVKSVKSYVEEADRARLTVALNPSYLELQQQFAKTLHSTFGMIAQQLRYEGAANLNITRANRFVPRMQLELCEQFLINGYESSQFLTMLGTELKSAIAKGLNIRGAWGHIEENSESDIVYELTNPNITSDASFVRATRIE